MNDLPLIAGIKITTVCKAYTQAQLLDGLLSPGLTLQALMSKLIITVTAGFSPIQEEEDGTSETQESRTGNTTQHTQHDCTLVSHLCTWKAIIWDGTCTP